MLSDDRAAAHITLEREKLREEPGREEAGIAPHAVVSQSDDVFAVRAEELKLLRDGLALEHRLVGHHEAERVTV